MLDIENKLTYHWHIIRGQVNGDMENYYKEMGFALHAVQDQWCPSHFFQEWHGGVDNGYHIIDPLQINSDKAIESSILLLQGNIGAAMRHY